MKLKKKFLEKKAPSLTPIGNFHFILAHSRSPILPPILPFQGGVLVYWCPPFQLFKQVFQLFKHFQVFFLAALWVCTKPVLWFNARLGSSIFISCSFPSFVLVRNGGKGCLHRGGGDETRRTQHARVVDTRRRRRSQTGQSESGDGGRSRNTHRPHQETHSLTHSSSGVWKRRHCDCVFEEDTTGHEP